MKFCTAKTQYGKFGNSKQIFPGKELRGLSLSFHIYASVSDLCIPAAAGKYVYQSREYINPSQKHECGN